MRKNLIIIGNTAFAQIAKEYFEKDSDYKVVSFAVESDFVNSDNFENLPLIDFNDLEKQFSPKNHSVYVAATYTKLNRLRTRLANESKIKGYSLASYISSKAFVWDNVKLGEHLFIFEDNTVQPYVEIGDNVLMWSGNHIGHHSNIKANSFISSHVCISGYCEVGENSFLGVNSTIANNVSIGKDNWIGPNFSIMRDTKDGSFFKTNQPEPEKISSLDLFKIEE